MLQIDVEFDSGPETSERKLQQIVEVVFYLFPEESWLETVEVRELE